VNTPTTFRIVLGQDDAAFWRSEMSVLTVASGSLISDTKAGGQR
jgi:hypothetical protein